jgi:hypothetical protein
MNTNHEQSPVIEQVTLKEAIKLLERASKQGHEIPHVVTVIRDPKNPSRILAINAVEQA